MIDLADAENLKKESLLLVKELKRHEKIRNKDMSQATQKQYNKRNADLTWCAMEIEKIAMRLHAYAVDCGVAKLENDEFYDEKVDFYPSALHHYQEKRPLPKVIINRKKKVNKN